ncbi:ankyrin repeat-containing domain protein [Nemania sp. FL0031]|nr:ankyrin repeat-containing domain protein [Nemania sp. FL0031]
MASSYPRPSEEQWLCHRALIKRLYLVEEIPLNEIVDQLRNISFFVTTNQLEYRLNKKWKFMKNICRDTWIEIDYCISKRKREEEKDSEVILCGKRVKQETVERETNRHRDRSIFTQLTLQRPSSPVIPAHTQVSVCTPQPLAMEFEWPITLPWLRFPVRYLQTMLSTYMAKTSDNTEFREEALTLANFHRETRLATGIAGLGVSELAATIGVSMPESFPQEHLQRAQCLITGSREDFLYESLLMVIYGLSNSLFNPHEGDQWQKTMAILKTCGLFEISSNLKALKSWTIDGFMEKLYYAAMDRLNDKSIDDGEVMAVLKWLLALGQSPIIGKEALSFCYCLEYPNPGYSTWREQRGLNLIRLLLEAGGDANSMPSHCRETGPRTILETVLVSQCGNETLFRMTELLLKHGASVNFDQALHLAVKKSNRRVIEMIIQKGGKLTVESERRFGLACKETALSIAAANGVSETQHILDLLRSQNPSRPIAEFITADVLISAVEAGHYDTASLLYSLSSIPSANDCGITPLHAAAYKGYLSMCQLFFSWYNTSGSNVTSVHSPLHVACYYGFEDVVHFLIKEGANTNAAVRLDETDIKHGDAVYRLFSHFGPRPPNDLTPLDMVFKNDNMSEPCAVMLIKAGAKLSGHEVHIAASKLYPNLLSVALAAGADPNRRDAAGAGALELALQNPQGSRRLYDVVALLLQNGATLLGGEISTLLHLTPCSGLLYDTIALLLKNGATLLGDEIRTLLRSLSFSRELYDILVLLLKNGATLLGGEISTLLYSTPCSRLLYDTTALLLKNGATLLGDEISKLLHSTPCSGLLYDTIVLLLKSGATLLGDEISTLLETNTYSRVLYETTALLLKNGATLWGGEITSAISCEDWDLVDLLLQHGGTLLDADDSGTTALEVAVVFDLTRFVFETAPGIYDAGSLCAAIETRQTSTVKQLLINRRTKPVTHELEVMAIGMAAELAANSSGFGLLQSLLEYPPSRKFGPIPLDSDFERQEYSSDERKFCLWGSPLALIAKESDNRGMEVCSELLKHGFQPDKLTWAVASDSNNVVFVQYLLDHNQRYEEYEHHATLSKIPNPLVGAVENDNKELAALLLRAGVRMEEPPTDRNSPLYLAVKTGKLEVLRCLLGAYINVDSDSMWSRYGYSLLRLAVQSKKMDIMRYLFEAGANINKDGCSILQWAVEFEGLEVVRHIVEAGIDVNKASLCSSLQLAIESNNLELVRYLIEAGIDVDEASLCSSLRLAIESNSLELVRYLIKAGVNVNEQVSTRTYGHSPLQLAVKLGDIEIADCLIGAGAYVNEKPARIRGATALQFAAIQGYLGIAKHLLDLGADVNAPPAEYYGRTALEGAAEWGRLDMLELLLAAGAETTGNWRHHFVRAVKLAMGQGHYTAANFLKQSGGWSEEDEGSFVAIHIEYSEVEV